MANKLHRKKALKKANENKSNPKTISKQKQINQRYSAARSALRKRINRLEKAGFENLPELPKIPKTKTEASIRKLNSMTRETMLKKATYMVMNSETGEFFEYKGKKAEAAYKEEQKAKKKKQEKRRQPEEIEKPENPKGIMNPASADRLIIGGWKKSIDELPDEYAKELLLKMINHADKKDSQMLAQILKGLTEEGYGVNDLAQWYKGKGKRQKTLSRFGSILYKRGLLPFSEWMHLDDTDNEEGEEYII